MSSKTKFLLIPVLLLGTIALLNWSFGTQVRNWHQAKLMARQHPYLALVPQPLPAMAPSATPGTTLSDFGYQFEVPWPTPKASNGGDGLVAYVFTGDQGLIFSNLAQSVSTRKNSSPVANQIMAALLGYDILKKSLFITPDQVSLLLSKKEASRRKFMLDLKEVDIPRRVSGLYSFEISGLRGFQIGNPDMDDSVEVICYDASSRRFEFYFDSKSTSNPRISQQDIYRVIASLRPAASSNGR